MVSNNNIFYATNPARMLDALWQMLDCENVNLSNTLIFLPSRRAVRAAEKMFADKNGGVAILPKLVALGEGADSQDENLIDAIPVNERVVVLAKLLSGDASVGNITTALPVAHDFVRIADYLENEGVDASIINWADLIDEKYAAHFKSKAEMLNILTKVLPGVFSNRPTQTAYRNDMIRQWCNQLDGYDLIVVCGSTASVPATADLMVRIAKMPNGRIILSGKIDGDKTDFALKTNPYNAESQFLMRIGVDAKDINRIDVGDSAIDFFNFAFGNDTVNLPPRYDISNCHLIECARESEEAAVVAEITADAIKQHKTVMIITPDAAGNQRIAAALAYKNIQADFSGGVSGTMVPAGRAILNMIDDMIDAHDNRLYDLCLDKGSLFDALSEFVMTNMDVFRPQFLIDDDASMAVWGAIKGLSDNLIKYNIVLNLSEIRAFINDTLAGVSVRLRPEQDYDVVVLGTIEARMQTADVVVLTGLNEGMFPSRGYENAWLPRDLSEKIGLPSGDRKVSLMALDFMNLSCGSDVYWLRSCVSGGVQTTESRFISRVIARAGNFDRECGKKILDLVRIADKIDSYPLDYSAPQPPADWSDVYVTELEKLIHNPYAFYAAHILRLRVKDDYWIGPDARAFGNLVHDVIEHESDFSKENLIAKMDGYAHEILGDNNVVYQFWHKRFIEMADMLSNHNELLKNSVPEIAGSVQIAGRNVRARADRVWDGGVLDIKTGVAPNKKQLLEGNMPQLPLEAFILQSGGFKIKTTIKSKTPVMLFLQLKNNDVRPIEYDADITAEMINAAVNKTTELFNMYSAGGAAYEYHETNDGDKYRAYDDLARRND